WTLMPQTLKPAEIKAVRIGDVALARTGGGWTVTKQGAPPAPAPATRVDDLLQLLASARAARHLGGGGVPFPEEPGTLPAPIAVNVNGADQLHTGLPCPVDPGLALVLRADGARLCYPPKQLYLLLSAGEAFGGR